MHKKSIKIAQRRVILGDPHDCTDAADELTILHAVFDTLVKRKGQRFEPHLAQSWSVSDDAQTWRFHLRAGHRFHDGTTCDAEAVAHSLCRMARADKGYTLGASGVWRQYLGGAAITPLDAVTLDIDLSEPMADLLDVLEQAFVVAPSQIAWLDQGNFSNPVGSGPYRMLAATQNTMTAARVPDHFAPGHYDEVTWLAEPNEALRRRLLHNCDVAVANDLAPDALDDPGLRRYTLLEYMSPVAIIYLLNAAKGPLADKRLRRAISLAVDRGRLIEDVLAGHARPLLGFVSPEHYGAGAPKGNGFDQNRARALVAQAGYANGLTLEVDCPTRLPDEAQRLTDALAGQLATIGITLKVHVHEDREAYAHMVRRKEIHDLCVFDSSPMSTFRVLYEKIDARVAGSWWQGYHNEIVEVRLDDARQEIDADARAGIYAAAYADLQEDPAWLTLYNPTRIIGFAGVDPTFTMPVDGVIDVTALPDGLG